MLKQLWNDENGVILSAEIVLIGTILIVGMVVGLTELQCAVVQELNDLGEAIGALNQSYQISSLASFKRGGGIKGSTFGSVFIDHLDACDGNECAVVCVFAPRGEFRKF